jgi:hypothetical protein
VEKIKIRPVDPKLDPTGLPLGETLVLKTVVPEDKVSEGKGRRSLARLNE